MPASYAVDDVQNQFVQLTNGKGILAYYSFTAKKLVVKQFASNGAVDATTNVSPSEAFQDLYTYYADSVKVCVYALSSTQALVFLTFGYKSGSYAYLVVNALIWNSAVASMTFGSVATATWTSADHGGVFAGFKVSPLQIFSYGTNTAYCVFYASAADQVAKQMIPTFRYNYSTNVLTKIDAFSLANVGTTNSVSSFFAYQNPALLDQIYVITTRPDVDNTQPVFYRIDLDTGVVEFIMTGSTGYFSTNFYMYNLGIGIKTNGADVYLYFNMVKPFLQGTERRLWIFQYVLKFDTTITFATLLASDELTCEFNPLLPASSTEVNWAVGYTTAYDKFRIIFPQRSGDVNYATYCDITITDFYDFGIRAFDIGTWTTENGVPVSGDNDKVSYNNNWYDMMCINLSSGLMFYGISPLSTAYDVTLAWVPNNNPALTTVRYTFTVSATLNGYAWQGKAIAVWQSQGAQAPSQFVWKIPNSLGKITFDFVFSGAGVYNFTIQLYDVLAGLVYTESFQLVVITGAAPPVGGTPGAIMPGFFEVFTGLIPGFLIVGIPAFALGTAGAKAGVGAMGFIFGALIGIGLGYMSGLIVPAIFYMVILFVGVMLVMVVRSKFSGG